MHTTIFLRKEQVPPPASARITQKNQFSLLEAPGVI